MPLRPLRELRTLCVVSFVSCALAGAVAAAEGPARSLILFIGDGVDDHQLTIARNYLFGNVPGSEGFSGFLIRRKRKN